MDTENRHCLPYDLTHYNHILPTYMQLISMIVIDSNVILRIQSIRLYCNNRVLTELSWGERCLRDSTEPLSALLSVHLLAVLNVWLLAVRLSGCPACRVTRLAEAGAGDGRLGWPSLTSVTSHQAKC